MPTYAKEIVYDFQCGDFALYLEDELVGYARSYLEGDQILDAMIADLQQEWRERYDDV